MVDINSELNNINLNSDNVEIPIPKIKEDIIDKIYNLIDKNKKSNKKKLSIGIIKFKYNNIDYIHCPIKKIKDKGTCVKIGICKEFEPIMDSISNRKILSSHYKFHHCKGKKLVGDNICEIKLKTSLSLEDFIKKQDDAKMKRKLKYDTCSLCNSKINKHY
jgi:hypothetical protein